MFQRIKTTAMLGKRLSFGIGLAHIIDLVHIQLGNGEPEVLGNFGKIFYRNIGILPFIEYSKYPVIP